MPSQSGPGSNGNEVVLYIPQSSSITGTSPSDCLESYPEHWLGGGLTPLQRCSWCILQPPADWATMRGGITKYIQLSLHKLHIQFKIYKLFFCLRLTLSFINLWLCFLNYPRGMSSWV